MAKPRIPNPLERRHVLERNLSPDQAIAYADLYIAEERPTEAVDFLVKAEASDRLDALAQDAIEAGDAFLLKLICGARGKEAGAHQWERLAEIASSRGLEAHAETARRQAAVIDE